VFFVHCEAIAKLLYWKIALILLNFKKFKCNAMKLFCWNINVHAIHRASFPTERFAFKVYLCSLVPLKLIPHRFSHKFEAFRLDELCFTWFPSSHPSNLPNAQVFEMKMHCLYPFVQAIVFPFIIQAGLMFKLIVVTDPAFRVETL